MSDPSDRNFLPNTDTLSFHNDFNSQSSSYNNNNNNKETGIIEKMLVSYGFIQCCERQARLFFHFSQYLGNIDHLKIGDPVEYETSFDRRTGKPVAINIKKIASNDFMAQLSQSDRLTGVIVTVMSDDREGRIAFENMGEFFFIPFGHEDNVNNINFKANDKVTFVLYTDDSGNYRATRVQLEESNLANNQGVINAIKDTFGFIERSDSMTKIFFHSSDCNDFKSLSVGDFVQFNVTSRKNKELAVNVVKQANSDEEFSEKIYKGQVMKYNNNNRSNLASGLVYCPEFKKEFFFYEKDVNGSFTLNPMDLITFRIATDRRTHYQRAVQINFLTETFIINSETREKGYVASLKGTYGFIKCPSKEGSLIYFKHSELLDPTIVLKLNDEVEFTFIADAQARKCQAIRISILPNGTLFNNILSKKQHHFNNVTEDFSLVDLSCPLMYNTDLKDTQMQDGINGNNGDSFSSTWTKELMDVFQKNDTNFPMINGNGTVDFNESPLMEENTWNGGIKKNGMIVVLKESYGFIESVDGENEYYFSLNSYNEENFKLGQSVEFDTLLSNGKWKAINVTLKDKIKKFENDLSEVFTGKIIRTIRMFDNEQNHYTGLVAKIDDTHSNTNEEDAKIDNDVYEFSMISLKFFKDYISVDDCVRFQLATNPVTKKKRAYNVEVIRDRLRGTILSMQRGYGFLKPENIAIVGNIYFNAAEIRPNAKIKNGDKVDFYLIKNKKTEKFYAIDINKSDETSPVNATDRTIFKTFIKTNDNGPKIIVIRQPRAPDGSKGFVQNETPT